MDSDVRGCFGCFAILLGTIATALVLWALAFGVTVGGRYYGLGLSCARGVEISAGTSGGEDP